MNYSERAISSTPLSELKVGDTVVWFSALSKSTVYDAGIITSIDSRRDKIGVYWIRQNNLEAANRTYYVLTYKLSR